MCLIVSLSLSCRYKRAFLLSRDEIRIEIQLFLIEYKASFLKTLLVTNVYHNSYICLISETWVFVVFRFTICEIRIKDVIF